jgi:orotidine-5'-phosphate decarboxylase
MHDIGNTVARGTESVAKLGATFLTVHAYPQTMKGAIEGRGGASLKILAVTVLTSYNEDDLHAAGYRLGVAELVEARAQQAQVLGIDGLVSSPEEVGSLRKIVGHQMSLVTPGIRPAGSATGDQKRIMTPGRAIAAGADYLVVGRPVVEASDPRAVADSIQAEIAQALG